MNFSIKCENLIRFSKIPSYIPPSVNEDVRKKINTVRVEIKSNKILLIATNEKIAAVELIGQTSEPDGCYDVILNPALLEQCEKEMTVMDSELSFTVFPDLAISTIRTSLGYEHKGEACYWFENSPLDNWRDWFPDTVEPESKGAMFWTTGHVKSLFESSPSGEIFFPDYIDPKKPTIIRDDKSPNWVGLFIPSSDKLKRKPATKPDWI